MCFPGESPRLWRDEGGVEEATGEYNICNSNIISTCRMRFMASINVCDFHLSLLLLLSPRLSSSSPLSCVSPPTPSRHLSSVASSRAESPVGAVVSPCSAQGCRFGFRGVCVCVGGHVYTLISIKQRSNCIITLDFITMVIYTDHCRLISVYIL